MTVTLILCCLFCHFVWNARWNDYYIYDIREAASRCVIMADRLYVGCFFFFPFFLFSSAFQQTEEKRHEYICALHNNSNQLCTGAGLI